MYNIRPSQRICYAYIACPLCLFLSFVARQVELFCIDHLVMVTVEANDEFLYLDLAFPTTKLHGRGMDEDGSHDLEGGLNGMEAAFQVSRRRAAAAVADEAVHSVPRCCAVCVSLFSGGTGSLWLRLSVCLSVPCLKGVRSLCVFSACCRSVDAVVGGFGLFMVWSFS